MHWLDSSITNFERFVKSLTIVVFYLSLLILDLSLYSYAVSQGQANIFIVGKHFNIENSKDFQYGLGEEASKNRK